jgi:hypothetical protein
MKYAEREQTTKHTEHADSVAALFEIEGESCVVHFVLIDVHASWRPASGLNVVKIPATE